MPAPGAQSTFDGNPNTSPATTAPYRPGSGDFNGMGLVDRAVNPPNAATMPTSALLNAWSAFAIVFGRMCPNLIMSVRYVAGAPLIDSFTATPTAVATNPALSTFTIARTGGGAANGDISVTWPAGTFPQALTQPQVSANMVLPTGHAVTCSIVAITNGVRIFTNYDGTPTDEPFTFTVM